MKKYISNLLSASPLCGISTYNDTLDLSNGAISRVIKKIVLTGQENITSTHLDIGLFNLETLTDYKRDSAITCLCTHLEARLNVTSYYAVEPNQCAFYVGGVGANIFYMRNTAYSTIEDFKQWLASEYNNNTPVTIWYVLATAETDTITVPTGLTGIVNGYLIQDGTPTPTNPVYPTANPVIMWADYTPQIYNSGWSAASGQPEKYNGGWS